MEGRDVWQFAPERLLPRAMTGVAERRQVRLLNGGRYIPGLCCA